MEIARVIEISAKSSQSFDDAVRKGVERANKTLRGVKGAWVKEMSVDVEDGQVVTYQVNLKVTFLMEDPDEN